MPSRGTLLCPHSLTSNTFLRFCTPEFCRVFFSDGWRQLRYSEQSDNKLFTQSSSCEPASYDHLLTSPIVLRRLQYFHNCGKIILHLTPSIESFQQTHFWPCIIHGYSSPTLAQGGSALSQSPSQDISL